jgi:carbon-monoxide dehydrogenase medium subunit
MKSAPFEYASPESLQEVVRLLASRPGQVRLLAGGQSLLPVMALRLAQPALLVDLRRVQALCGVTIDDHGVALQARTRWRDIEDHAGLHQVHPLLWTAVRHVGNYQVRNRGTVGGSLAFADPGAELPCVAVTCDARLHLLGPQGERVVEASRFFTGPLSTVLRDDELIVALRLPPWPADRRWAFLEISRGAGHFALAGVALHYVLGPNRRVQDAHLGVLGAGSRPERLAAAEAALNGMRLDEASPAALAHVADAAQAGFRPPGDHHASVPYRRALLATLVTRALRESMATPRGAGR